MMRAWAWCRGGVFRCQQNDGSSILQIWDTSQNIGIWHFGKKNKKVLFLDSLQTRGAHRQFRANLGIPIGIITTDIGIPIGNIANLGILIGIIANLGIPIGINIANLGIPQFQRNTVSVYECSARGGKWGMGNKKLLNTSGFFEPFKKRKKKPSTVFKRPIFLSLLY